MNILDIFYNEIIKEAALGKVSSYFVYNILFLTEIVDKRMEASDEYSELLIPTLRIKNKEEFDRLLVEYVITAKEFYGSENFPFENISEEEIEKHKIKTIMTLMFSNATFEDFNNPCEFLKKRIDFLNNTKREHYDLGHSPLLKANLKLDIKKDLIFNETPYQFSLTSIDDDKKYYAFPCLKFGISDGKAYVYAIQSPDNDYENESKKVNRALYKIGEGFDYKEDNYDIYEEGNLEDVTASFVVVANMFCSYLKSLGINEIVMPSLLIERWNAKEISYKRRINANAINEGEYNSKKIMHIGIQSNLTEKFIRTFLRLTRHYPNIDILSYPTDIDDSLHLNINNLDGCNNKLLIETSELIKDSIHSDKKL